MKIYLAAEIRGIDGELASPAKIEHNLRLACQHAQVLREYFPEIEWIVPHENDIVNMLHKMHLVDSQSIIDAELELIRTVYDGVVVVGVYHKGTGVAQEIVACNESDKFLCILENTDEPERLFLARKIAEWIGETDEDNASIE